MNNPKEIAEKILNCKTYDIPDIQSVARAYLELEKSTRTPCPECGYVGCVRGRKACDSEIDNLNSEITKLKEENKNLKKSREVLRKAAEFYGDKSHWEYWHNHDVGTFTEWNTLRQEVHCGGKKAREAIKADDEIMEGE